MSKRLGASLNDKPNSINYYVLLGESDPVTCRGWVNERSPVEGITK